MHDTYARPFLLSPAQFAQRAYAAIAAGSSYRVIPWQMAIVAKLLRLLPNWLFDAALAGRPRKPRKITPNANTPSANTPNPNAPSSHTQNTHTP